MPNISVGNENMSAQHKCTR